MIKNITLVRKAKLMPFQGLMDNFASGVFDGDQCLADSLIPKRSEPSALLPVTKKLAGPHIFGGYLFGHFGHFLTESLSRAYAFKQCPSHPIVYMSPNKDIFNVHRIIFKFLGIRNKLVLIKEPTEIEQLVVAPAGCILVPPLLSDEQVKALTVFDSNLHEPTNAKLWLSRSTFKGGSLENEAEIEAELERMGWIIVHPQNLPMYEQVRLISTAAYVAGLEGSAFYSALFAQKIYGKYYVFSRRNMVPEFLDLALTKKNIPHEIHSELPLQYSSGQGANRRFILLEPSRIIDVLKNV